MGDAPGLGVPDVRRGEPRLPRSHRQGLLGHLLDAAAVAWSAQRIAAGQATTLTSPGQRADDGTEIAIRY